jgi:hypothetical protein
VRPPERAAGAGLAAATLQALKEGTAALGWTVLAAQVYSFIIYFVSGRPFRPWSFVKIGWLFLLSFSRVGLRLKVGGILGSLLVGPSRGEVTITIHVAFLSGTALACWLLFRAGRRAGRSCGGALSIQTAAGAAVALPYAAVAYLGSYLAVLRFPDQNVPLVSAVRWEAFVFPLIMAGVSGAAGALIGGLQPGRMTSSAIGGWRAFVSALALSLVGLLVLGAIYPNGTSSYVRWLWGHGHLGPLTFALQLLALPNHASFILAPAMGGCDTLALAPHVFKVLCISTLAGPHLSDFLSQIGSPQPGVATPWAFWLFLIVPSISTVAGARWAARGQLGWSGRVMSGTGAGLFFAALVFIASWAAGIQVVAVTGPTRLGPALGTTAVLAIAWGLVGGAVGGSTARWAQVGGSPVPDPGELVSGAPPVGEGVVGPDDRPDPPSPTSV